ncbi:MAG TPA: response regulator transcription factor [Usitatibacteraceae bacterium]
MTSTRVLLIEDDLRLARMVEGFLSQNGFSCEHALDASKGMAAFRREPFDLVLLDLMLPDADGLDVCRDLRSRDDGLAKTPIIMVTARGDLSDRVTGLELGADDYLAKPFEPRELLARVRAVLRRTLVDRTRSQGEVLNFGRLEIDRRTRQVRLDQEVRVLTSFQFDLLVALAQNAGRVLSRDQLRQSTRGEPLEAFDRAIDVHIGKIRVAIEDDVRFPTRIITVRNVGYVFSKIEAA